MYGSGGSILSSLISKGVRSTGIEALSLFEKSNSTGMCVNKPRCADKLLFSEYGGIINFNFNRELRFNHVDKYSALKHHTAKLPESSVTPLAAK